ncbi:MAG: hypothetical protein AAFO89_11600 [Planctomycetota bacterium]
MLCLLGGLTAYVVVRPEADLVDPIPFDSELWRDSARATTHDEVRVRMIDDLLARQILVGQQKQKVIEILGSPDGTDDPQDREMVYFVGVPNRRTYGPSLTWLVLSLDDQDRVVSIRIAED